ncbi:MAG: hypothetical protein EA381_06025 [Planctomycetaceae bacterium]|nr:MAG: hypothetical protein EA381_06025 [Planctomycetaceae bacterium]
MVAIANSRQAILDRLKSIPIEQPPAPVVDPQRLVRYDDPLAKFTEVLSFVGGQVHVVERPQQVSEILGQFPAFRDAQQVASSAPEILTGNIDLNKVADPHLLAYLDWAIIPGRFAVAENGAIWVRPTGPIERAMLFLTQHLVIVVPKTELIEHMHEAYRRLGQDGVGTSGPEFGIFISGPSKTADIEQSLVIGAHGCRTLQVFLIDDSSGPAVATDGGDGLAGTTPDRPVAGDSAGRI